LFSIFHVSVFCIYFILYFLWFWKYKNYFINNLVQNIKLFRIKKCSKCEKGSNVKKCLKCEKS
jgi:hypothetical protein